MRLKLFSVIDSDPTTQEIRFALGDFESIEAYILSDPGQDELRLYIIIKLINIAIYEGNWNQKFIGHTNSLDFDYSHPQNIAAIEWFGSNECSARHEWVCLCESWNQQVKKISKEWNLIKY